MTAADWRDWLVTIRRDLHRRPEPAWREFYTTARLLEYLDELAIDDLSVTVGPDSLALDARAGVPDDDELERWREQARNAGAGDAHLNRFTDGATGFLATLDRGDGPTIALRVDVDGLPVAESTDEDHEPVAGGFRSENEGYMHACGHDAHAAIGLGTLRAVAESDFQGTLKVIFQPAEEVIGGGKAVAESGHLDDVDYLLALHVGLDHPTGEVVAGIDGFLAVSQFDAHFSGEGAHAGGNPQQGRNAVQAMAAAVQNLYAIPRHRAGATRVNAGKVGGGTASNVVPESAFVEGEVRGETTDLMEYARDRAEAVFESAAEMYDCEVTIEPAGEAPSAESDEALVDLVTDVAGGTTGVTSVLRRDELGGSEDATFLMQRVQDHGGLASYVCVGTDHPGGHHTATFDVDEDSLVIGVDILAGAIERLTATRP